MNKLTILKYGLVLALLLMAFVSFIGGNALVGAIALIAFTIFVYLNFIQPQFIKEPINKKELIDKLIHTLDYDYKQSLGEDNFELYADIPHSSDEHKFVFTIKDDDSIQWYFPCTINIYTGQIGAMTGTKTDKVNEAEFFLHGERKPLPRPKIDQELIDELVDSQKELIKDEVNRALGADIRENQERV